MYGFFDDVEERENLFNSKVIDYQNSKIQKSFEDRTKNYNNKKYKYTELQLNLHKRDQRESYIRSDEKTVNRRT